MDINKIERCAQLLPEPGDKVVMDLIKEIRILRKSGEMLWDTVTDVISQEQIDKIERLCKHEIAKFVE